LAIPQFATLFVRSDIIKGITHTFCGHECNDMIIRLFCAVHGTVYYLNKNMSCYRQFTETSWTKRMGVQRNKLIKHYEGIIPFLLNYDQYTHGIFSKAIKACIERRQFELALMKGEYSKARKMKNYTTSSLKRKIYISLGTIAPRLINWLRQK